MKKQYLVQLFFLMCFGLTAQTQQGTLWHDWEDQSLSDSLRAKAMNAFIHDYYVYSQPDSALILGDLLVDFCNRKQFSEGIVDAHNTIGFTYFYLGDYPKALAEYKAGLMLAQDIKYDSGAATALLRTGIVYHENDDLIAALGYYQRSLVLYIAANDKMGQGYVYNELGNMYLDKQEFEKSLEYYNKTLALFDEEQKEREKADILLNVGNVYFEQNNTVQALAYYKKSLDVFVQHGNKSGIAYALNGQAVVFNSNGDYKKAMDYLQQSLEINQEIKSVVGIIEDLLTIAKMNIEQEKFVQAIQQCQKSLSLSESLGDIGNQMASCQCLYAAYKAVGNTKAALTYYESVMVFADSLQSEETARKMQQMEFAQQVVADSLLQVEKDLKIQLAHQAELFKKEKNRNIAIGAGLFFLLLSGGFFSRWRYVQKSKTIIEKERDRSESLLLNILPAEIAEELKAKGKADARDFDLVSILFTDFKGFTEKSENLTAKELIEEINHCFMAFDHICEKYHVEKIKTIGDAYMAAGGLPLPSDDAVQNTVLAALEMQDFINERMAIKLAENEIYFEMRAGIHTGPVVAGIVGVKKFQYDIWGDTVNTASRMESGGQIGQVNISQNTYELIKDNPKFTFQHRGKIHVKGKKEMDMYFVNKTSEISKE